jgi:UTP--glucose-1-phosphate uridylyltransferase
MAQDPKLTPGSPAWEQALDQLEKSDGVKLDRDMLRSFQFDPALLDRLRTGTSGVEAKSSASSGAAVDQLPPLQASQLSPLQPGDVLTFDDAAATRPELIAQGETMLRNGEVAVLVWAGGMATRFGGVVKACVEAVDGMTFLGAKMGDARHAAERLKARVPFLLMASFATQAALQKELEEHRNYGLPAEDVFLFSQSVLLRVGGDGKLHGEAGHASPYAPGHGDFFASLRRSGALTELRRRGVKLVAASNVDNLGALLDPAMLALVRATGRPMVAEVTRAAPGEKGASAVRVDGEVRLVEYVRLPQGIALADALLNTNNLYFSLDALDQDIPLPFFPVAKKIDGKPVVQFEQITCEVCAVRAPGRPDAPLMALGLVDVPRGGPRGRFYPVKEPADLEAVRPELRARLRAAWGQPG